MRIVFMGSAPLACPSLEAVAGTGSDEVVAVVTQPDRPRGRSLRLLPGVVKETAVRLGLPAMTPVNVNSPEALQALRDLRPDLIVVVAYGQILRSGILALPPMGCVNLHASLLPKYRGAAPIQWAIANGETVTGVTVMYMNERVDAGDIVLQKEVPIGPEDTAGTLHDRLAAEGAPALARALADIRQGRAGRLRQDEAKATPAPKLAKEDGRMDWNRPAAELERRVRAFNPWPGSFCAMPSERPAPLSAEAGAPEQDRSSAEGPVLRIAKVRVEDAAPPPGKGTPGEVVDVAGDGPLILTGRGAVRLVEVQPEGKKPMSGTAYLRGHPMKIGDVLAGSSREETSRGRSQ
jgi:methionyl-tRNA formyltransferase